MIAVDARLGVCDSARDHREVDTAAAQLRGELAPRRHAAVRRRASIRTKRATLVIECDGVDGVVIPHEEPWGPSDYMNAARVISEPSGLRIEMSSGDEIVIRARTVTLNRERLRALF